MSREQEQRAREVDDINLSKVVGCHEDPGPLDAATAWNLMAFLSGGA